MFSEIDLGSSKLGKGYAERNAVLCTVIQKIAEGLAAAIKAAVARAAPNYMPLARQANAQVFILGPSAIPNGPYRPAE